MTSDGHHVEIAVAALPTITLARPDPPSPIKGQPVVFTDHDQRLDQRRNPVRSVRIEFGDGDFEDLGAVAGTTSVSHVYSNDGAYT